MESLAGLLEDIKLALDYLETFSASSWITLSSLVVGGVFLRLIYKSNGSDKYRKLYFSGIFISLLLIVFFQTYRLWYVNTLPISSPKQIFESLKYNKRVTWVVRLIPYCKSTEQFLTIQRLNMLGPENQEYVFVADYDELKNLTISDAVYRLGLSLANKDSVSAIIFPLGNRELFPASARGVLQVIMKIDAENTGITGYIPFNLNALPDSEAQRQLQDQRRVSWSWTEYSQYYDSFRNAVKFAIDNKISALQKIGTIGPDWHATGYSQILDTQGSNGRNNIFHLTTNNKEDIKMPNFGARAFLIRNMVIKDIGDVALIQFSNPDQERIPDFGGRKGTPPQF